MNFRQRNTMVAGMCQRQGRVNGRLVLILAASLAVFGTVIHFVHGYMVERNAKSLYDRAVSLLDEAEADETAAKTSEGDDKTKLETSAADKRDDAVKYLGQYVRLEPDDHEAWLLFAESSDKFQKDGQSLRKNHERMATAVRKLESARDLKTAGDDVDATINRLRRRVIEMGIQIGIVWGESAFFGNANRDIEKLREDLQSAGAADDAELDLWSGICHEKLGEWQSAASAYGRAVFRDPEMVEAWQQLMWLVQQHSEDFNFREAISGAKPDATPNEVAKALGAKMVASGKPRYKAYLANAMFLQNLAATTSDENTRRESLDEAVQHIRESITALDDAIAQQSESEKNAEDSPANDIEPLLTSVEIFRRAAEVARDENRTDDRVELLKEARQSAEEARSRQPENLRCYLALATTEQTAQVAAGNAQIDYEPSIKVLREGLAQIPETQKSLTGVEQQLWLTLAQTMLADGYGADDPAAAEKNQELDDVLAKMKERGIAPDRLEYLQAMRLYYNRKWQQAAAGLEVARERFVNDPSLSLQLNKALANCYGAMGNLVAELDAWHRAKALAPLDVQVRLSLTSALMQAGQYDAAAKEAQVLRLAIPGVGETLARIQLHRTLEAPPGSRNWMGAINQFNEILKGLESIDRKYSGDWTLIQIAIIQAYEQIAGEAVEADRNTAITALKSATDVLQKAMVEQPDSPLYPAELANVQMMQAVLAESDEDRQAMQAAALATLDQAAERQGDSIDLRMTRGNVLANIHADDEEQTAVLKQLQQLSEENLEAFSDADKVRLWHVLSRAYLRLGQTERARDLWAQAVALLPFNLGHQRDLFDLERAVDRQLIAQLTPDLAADEAARITARHENQMEALRQIVGNIRAIEGPGGPNGHLTEAFALLSEIDFRKRQLGDYRAIVKDQGVQNNARRASRLLSNVETKMPRYSPIPNALGSIEQLLGNEEAAIDHFLRAFNLGDVSPSTVNPLVPLLAKHNRNQEVSEIVKRVEQNRPGMLSSPEFSVGNMTLAGFGEQASIRQGDFAEALDLLERTTKDPDDDANYQLRVGVVRWQRARSQQRVAEATDIEEPLRKAAALAPNQPNAWMVLVSYLLEAGRVDDAKQEVKNAKAQYQGKDNHRLLANLYRMLGDHESAAAEFEIALQESPDDAALRGEVVKYYLQIRKPDTAETVIKTALAANGDDPQLQSIAADYYVYVRNKETALKYLEKLLNPEAVVDEQLRRSARRRKALLVGTMSRYQESQQALLELDANLQDGPTVADLRTKAAILKSQATKEAQRQWIEVLEQIDATGSMIASERFQLAQLYRMDNRWDEAKQQFLELIDTESDPTQYIAEYVDGLITKGQLSDARPFINRLEQLTPDSMSLALIQAKLLAAGGDADSKDAAADVLTGYLSKHPAPQIDRSKLRRMDEISMSENPSAEAIFDVFQEFVAELDDPEAEKVSKNVRKLIAEDKSQQAIRLMAVYSQKTILQAALNVSRTLAVAKLLESLKVYSPAEKIYRDYVRLSDRPEASLELAAFLGRRGRVTEALRVCDELPDSVPEERVIGLKVGLLRTDFATPAEAQRISQDVEKAVAADPNSVRMLMHLAALRDYQRQDSEAEKVYNQILKSDPDSVFANNNLAWLLAMREGGNRQKALELINAAIKYRGPVAEFLDTRATVHMSLGKAKAAIKDLQEAISATEENKAMYFHLAQAYLMDDNFTDAKRALATAQQLGLAEADLHPREIEAYHNLLRRLGFEETSKKG